MNKQKLIEYFEFAINNNYKYIAVQIKIENCKEPEIIINKRNNFEFKLDYYEKSYNDQLELNHCKDIKIINVCIGNSFNELENMLK